MLNMIDGYHVFLAQAKETITTESWWSNARKIQFHEDDHRKSWSKIIISMLIILWSVFILFNHVKINVLYGVVKYSKFLLFFL